ncbi:MAG: ABC transporter ATP-binding protein [Clostridiales bacterium]|nr:ABC transporter ATP-binding protein [Clostridiales bacterium]
MNKNERKRSAIGVMAGLIGMVKPLLGFMALAIFMGCIGNLMATFITVLGGYGLLTAVGLYDSMSFGLIFALIIIFAVLRGILRYAEQASNHFIAFKLLARIRHQVFAALRRLAPAKLCGSEKGNLISIITSDIELLEVFYAHTISPIAIAVITSIVMICFMAALHPAAAAAALVFYLIVGLVIPVINGHFGSRKGLNYRNLFGKLNTAVLDNLYGLEEILQYGQKEKRLRYMDKRTEHLEQISKSLKDGENVQRVAADWVILAAGIVMAVTCGALAAAEQMENYEAVIAVVAMMSSFGPTAALSSLSNNLNQTLASGNRVLNLLEEEPEVSDVFGKRDECAGEIVCEHVSFQYKKSGANKKGTNSSEAMRAAEQGNSAAPEILSDFCASFDKGKIHGLLGKSGCGKSTLLKLLMRFYETNSGSILYGTDNVNNINTQALRRHIAYVEQETFLFHDTIENNIKVANAGATREMVIAAAKRAAIHDFIESLPEGYETKLSELGDSISGGERQRIGIARAFLHDSEVILLDEPTSNIDSLNEGIILKSLNEAKKEKTIILVSHRASTMGVADDVIKM